MQSPNSDFEARDTEPMLLGFGPDWEGQRILIRQKFKQSELAEITGACALPAPLEQIVRGHREHARF